MDKKYKNGFTLVEVLITLAIVGVVAALTIPLLMTQVQNMRYKTEFKKLYSSIEQATVSLRNNNGGSLNGVFTDDPSMYSAYATTMNFVTAYDSSSPPGNYVFPKVHYFNGNDGHGDFNTGDFTNGSYTGILNNGALVNFFVDDQTCSDTHVITGTPICGIITVAVEGTKGPNILGRDIFLFYVGKDKNIPYGAPNDAHSSNDCGDSINSQGYACPYWVLTNQSY